MNCLKKFIQMVLINIMPSLAYVRYSVKLLISQDNDLKKNELKNMATLKDIANLTGVSIRTVSRALKNDGYIKEDVKKQVLAAASQLNYSPQPHGPQFKN
jgi:hypothetical protein